MEFLFIIALVAVGTRKYKSQIGVRPVKLNPNHYRKEDAFMVMYNLVMKEGRIKYE